MIQRERLIETFLRLCRTNTPARQEAVLADLLQERLERLGLTCVRDDSRAQTGSDTGNLIGTLGATVPGAPALFFAAHMDTVEPNPGVNIIVEGDEIRTDGRTILGADDRAGIAPILEALQVIVEENIPHGTIQVVFTVCEEIGLLGAKSLDTSLLSAGFGYVLDSGPPVGSIVNEAPSQDSMDIVIKGRPAHAGAEPEKGVSAIQVAARAIDRMRLGRLDHETTANVGVIHGGQATNIVCPEVILRAEARSRNPEKLKVQVEHMVAAVHEAASFYGATAEVNIDHQYDAYRLSENDPVLALALRAIRAVGREPVLKAVGGGSDANVLNARGLPTCVLGTAMSGVHTHEEKASIEDLCRTAELVVAIVREAAAAEC